MALAEQLPDPLITHIRAAKRRVRMGGCVLEPHKMVCVRYESILREQYVRAFRVKFQAQ